MTLASAVAFIFLVWTGVCFIVGYISGYADCMRQNGIKK